MTSPTTLNGWGEMMDRLETMCREEEARWHNEVAAVREAAVTSVLERQARMCYEHETWARSRLAQIAREKATWGHSDAVCPVSCVDVLKIQVGV